MEIDGSLIYILFAIAYFIFQFFTGGKKKKRKKVAPPVPSTKTIERQEKRKDPVEDLSKGLTLEENKKQIAKKQSELKKRIEASSNAKYAMINESHRINSNKKYDSKDLELVDLEEDMENQSTSSSNSFDINSINWRDAIISKEILDRKYN